MVGAVSAERLKATDDRLVGFGTATIFRRTRRRRRTACSARATGSRRSSQAIATTGGRMTVALRHVPSAEDGSDAALRFGNRASLRRCAGTNPAASTSCRAISTIAMSCFWFWLGSVPSVLSSRQTTRERHNAGALRQRENLTDRRTGRAPKTSGSQNDPTLVKHGGRSTHGLTRARTLPTPGRSSWSETTRLSVRRRPPTFVWRSDLWRCWSIQPKTQPRRDPSRPQPILDPDRTQAPCSIRPRQPRSPVREVGRARRLSPTRPTSRHLTRVVRCKTGRRVQRRIADAGCPRPESCAKPI